jgi:hypothetical protein
MAIDTTKYLFNSLMAVDFCTQPRRIFHITAFTTMDKPRTPTNNKKQWREKLGIKSLPTDPDPDSKSLLTLEEVEA